MIISALQSGGSKKISFLPLRLELNFATLALLLIYLFPKNNLLSAVSTCLTLVCLQLMSREMWIYFRSVLTQADANLKRRSSTANKKSGPSVDLSFGQRGTS